MPYIITTTPRPTHNQLVARIDGVELPVTRTAVATLDEARGLVAAIIGPRMSDGAANERASYVSESGDTIGPLPDGAVIEVRQVTWDAIRADVGTDALAEYPSAQAAILAAFNA